MALSLTKFDLNNQIVIMRHNVNRAKVQTITKMIRQIRMLRNKKGPDNLKKKNEEKANKLLKELLVMKNIPHDEIAAFSLSNSKSADSILKDTNSSERLKSLSRLSLHNSIAPVVQMFHSKYPNWETEVPKVLIALKTGTKIKLENEETSTKQNKKKATRSKRNRETQENMVHASSGDDEEKEDEGEEDDEERMLFSDNSSDSSHSENESKEEMSEEESFVMSKGNRFSISSDSGTDLSPNKIKNELLPKIKKKVASNRIENIDFRSDSDSLNEESSSKISDVEDNLPNLDSQKSINIKTDNEISKFNEKSNAKQIKNIDPFFIGSNNEEYETLNPIVSSNDDNLSLNNDRNFNLKFNNINFKNKSNFKNVNKSNKQSDRQFKSNFNRNPSGKQNNFKNDKVNKNNNLKFGRSKGREGNINVKNQDKPENLHPSWEAKKKISSIVPFTGQKIVF